MERARSLSDGELEKVRAALRTLIDAEGSQVAAAKRIGVSQPTLSNALSGLRPPGVALARRVASALGITLDQLLTGRRETTVVRDSRYPNLERAIEFALHSGRAPSPAAVESVRTMALKSPSDQTTEAWLEDLRAEDRRLAREAGPQLPGRELPAPEGRPPLEERLKAIRSKREK